MQTSLVLDQPDLIAPERTRRLRFGEGAGIAILNARGARYEGGGDEPELSLKWIPQGQARYHTQGRTFCLRGETQLLLNRGQPYALEMREPSESLVVFFNNRLANAAWSARVGRSEAFGEVPSVLSSPPAPLHVALTRLRIAARRDQPQRAELVELSLALLNDVADLAFVQRAMLQRVPSVRHATRAELLRRVARAETYLVQSGHSATLQGAADAAALSPFHLIRVFRAIHGETPLIWATGKRLETARNALLLTDDPIESIAFEAGYASRTAFDRAFQRRFRDTPGRLRARR